MFAINVLLARLVSPTDLGLYFLIFSISMFFSIIARFGMKQTVVKIVAEALSNNNVGAAADAVKKVLIIALIGTFIIGLVLKMGVGQWIAIGIFHSEEMASYVPFLVAWMAALALLSPASEAFRGMHCIGWGAALDTSASNMLLALLLAALFFSNTAVILRDVLFLAVAAYFFFVLLGLLRLRIKLKSNHKDKVSFGYIFSISTPVFLINISTYVVANASLWVVGYFLAPHEVGIYGSVLKLFNLIALPLIVTNMAIDPIITRMHVKGQTKKLQDIMQLSATLAFLVTTVLTLILVFYGDDLLGIVFGQAFVSGYPVLLILVLGNLVNVWTGSCNNYLIMTGRQTSIMAITIITGVLSIVLSIILVQIKGMVGVAMAVAVSVALRNLLAWGFVYKSANIFTNATANINRLLSLAIAARSSRS